MTEVTKGGEIRPETFRQDEHWIDAAGRKHQLDDMPKDYLANVLSYSIDRAEYLYALDKGQEPVLGFGVDDAGFGYFAEAYDWLEATPLIRAIKLRLAQA